MQSEESKILTEPPRFGLNDTSRRVESLARVLVKEAGQQRAVGCKENTQSTNFSTSPCLLSKHRVEVPLKTAKVIDLQELGSIH